MPRLLGLLLISNLGVLLAEGAGDGELLEYWMGPVAVTTSSRAEIQWITEDVGRIFPEAWTDFAESANAEPGERVIEAYARRLAGQDREDARRAALSWDRWESTHISLDPSWLPGLLFEDERERTTFALLVTHYWAKDGFLVDGQEIIPADSRAQRHPWLPHSWPTGHQRPCRHRVALAPALGVKPTHRH